MSNASLCILIPAYEPTNALVLLIQEIKKLTNYFVIVVNDGSRNPQSKKVFEHLQKMPGLTLLHHSKNLGKGAALKTGFQYFLEEHRASGIITADADGQHTAADIYKICQEFIKNPNCLHLGIRDFSNKKKSVPWRSRLGNKLTNFIFRQLTAADLQDTQTGLRGIPRLFLHSLCRISTQGYEFELEMLFKAHEEKIKIKKTLIQTIYTDNNNHSHFRPLLDSLKIYFVFFRFIGVSLSSAALDFAFFIAFYTFTQQLFPSVILARMISASVNFYFNKRVVFKNKEDARFPFLRYLSLATVLMVSSYLLTLFFFDKFLDHHALYFCKFIAEGVLFIISFSCQKIFVFKNQREDFSS